MKKFKKTEMYLNGTTNEKEEQKRACVSIFSELLLTGKFQHYLRINATSCYGSYIDFYTLITCTSYISYITYAYNYTSCIDYFVIY